MFSSREKFATVFSAIKEFDFDTTKLTVLQMSYLRMMMRALKAQ